MNKQAIIDDYFKTRNCKITAKNFNMSASNVCRILKKEGIKPFRRKIPLPSEEIIHLYTKEMMPMYKIGERYGVSEALIKNVLKENGVESRSCGYQTNCNVNYFDTIDTEEKAYFLGLLLSDGGVVKKGIRIELQSGDKYILELMKNAINPKTEVRAVKNKNTHYVGFMSKDLKTSVEKYGLLPNKGEKLTKLLIKGELIPNHLYHHYIRGLFDGNGTVTYGSSGARVGYNAHRKEFVEDFQSFISNELDIACNKIHFGTVYFNTWGSQTDVRKFYEYIYKDATIFLKRKKEKIEKYLR